VNVGAAEVDITPKFEVELCGFALREQPCAGVLDPIVARAIYLDDERGGRLLWIVADVLALDGPFVDEFRAWAGKEFGLRAEQVMLAATHTHFAPATIILNAAGAKSERFVELLREGMQRAAREAIARTKPCDVVTARGRLDLSIDRRKKPTHHVDPTVWALGFREPGNGKFVAAVLNYAMHPVSLGHVERRVSPDWCGGASESLASALASDGERPTVLVANGACGNINPPYHGASRDEVFGWGKQVADAVGDVLRSAPPQRDAAIKVRSVIVPMQLDTLDAAGIDRLADKMINEVAPTTAWPNQFNKAVTAWRDSLHERIRSGGGRTHDIELQAARIGDVIVLAINGEVFARFTDDLRRAIGNEHLFVVGYANSAFGYIPTREAYTEGGYEVETAHFFYNSFRPQPGSLEMLCDRAAELVRSLPTPSR